MIDTDRLAREIHHLYCPWLARFHPTQAHEEDDRVLARIIAAHLHERPLVITGRANLGVGDEPSWSEYDGLSPLEQRHRDGDR